MISFKDFADASSVEDFSSKVMVFQDKMANLDKQLLDLLVEV